MSSPQISLPRKHFSTSTSAFLSLTQQFEKFPLFDRFWPKLPLFRSEARKQKKTYDQKSIVSNLMVLRTLPRAFLHSGELRAKKMDLEAHEISLGVPHVYKGFSYKWRKVKREALHQNRPCRAASDLLEKRRGSMKSLCRWLVSYSLCTRNTQGSIWWAVAGVLSSDPATVPGEGFSGADNDPSIGEKPVHSWVHRFVPARFIFWWVFGGFGLLISDFHGFSWFFVGFRVFFLGFSCFFTALDY